MMKRGFDIIAALSGLIVLAPLFAIVALLVKADSAGPIFFRQERIGRGFRPFWIYKFRTMIQDAPQRGGILTAGGDPRITRAGCILRQTKIDELPQLINVLRGDMSLVGPRPEVPKYVKMFRHRYVLILAVRPGITDLASLKYRDEAAILARSENPESEYVGHILPDKLWLAEEYIRRSSLTFDFIVIFKTFMKLISGGNSDKASHLDASAPAYRKPQA